MTDIIKDYLIEQKGKFADEAKQYYQEHIDSNLGSGHNDSYDAFRHAYVSGRFTQEYGKIIAHILGNKHENDTENNPPKEENMDKWNNAVGRYYGDKFDTATKLGDMLKDALKEPLKNQLSNL